MATTSTMKDSLIAVIAAALRADPATDEHIVVERTIGATGLRRATWFALTTGQQQAVIWKARREAKEAPDEH